MFKRQLLLALAALCVAPAVAAGETSPQTNRHAGAATPAAHSPAAARQVTENWQARDGETLRGVLQRWAAHAGWQLQWQPRGLDYAVVGTWHVDGDFETAVESLAFAYAHVRQPLKFKFWTGNKVLVVTEK